MTNLNETKSNNEVKYEKIINELKLDSNFMAILKKMGGFNKKGIIFIIVGFLVGTIGTFTIPLLFLFYETLTISLGLIFTIIIVLSGFIMIGYAIFCFFKAMSIKKKEFNKTLAEINWTHIYSEVLDTFFKKQNIKILELQIQSFEFRNKKLNDRSKSNKIKVEYKKATILFDIISQIVETKSTNSKGETSTSYDTYFREYLNIERQDLIFKSSISMTQNKIFKKGNYESESVAFNKRFNLESSDHLLLAKTFSPKVIDEYSTLKISKKLKYIKFDSRGIESLINWHRSGSIKDYEIALFRVYMKIEKYLHKMVDEIIEDLNKLIKNLINVEPLL